MEQFQSNKISYFGCGNCEGNIKSFGYCPPCSNMAMWINQMLLANSFSNANQENSIPNPNFNVDPTLSKQLKDRIAKKSKAPEKAKPVQAPSKKDPKPNSSVSNPSKETQNSLIDPNFPPISLEAEQRLISENQAKLKQEHDLREAKKKERRQAKSMKTKEKRAAGKHKLKRLNLQLIDVGKESRLQAEKGKYGSCAIRRTGGYQVQKIAVEKSKQIASRDSKKKLSKLKKTTLEFQNMLKNQVSKSLPPANISHEVKAEEESEMEIVQRHQGVQEAKLPPQQLAYSEDSQRLIEKLNSKEMRSSYPENIEIREYVDNILQDETERNILKLINTLSFRFQLKKKVNPLKCKKRLASGFGEVIRACNNRLESEVPKLVVIAVDIQRNPLSHGTDESVEELIELLHKKQIAYCFAGTRRELGGVLYGNMHTVPTVKCSCIGVVDFQGSEEAMKTILQQLEVCKKMFEDVMSK